MTDWAPSGTVCGMSRTPPHIALAVATVAFVLSILIAIAAVGVADAKPAGPAAAHSAAVLAHVDTHPIGRPVAGVDVLTGDRAWYVA